MSLTKFFPYTYIVGVFPVSTARKNASFDSKPALVSVGVSFDG